MIRNLINEIRPKWVATVFDYPESTFRHELYPEYKSNREPKPEELKFQIEQLRLISGGMGLNPVLVRGIEADDIIATIASSCNKRGIPTLISTRDKDLAALVSPFVRLIDKDGSVTDSNKVKDRYGVNPNQICDWLTLKGDVSDNIPGIMGCGDKKAAALLERYGSLNTIIVESKTIPGVLGERIRANIEQLQNMREVVQLKSNLQIISEPDCYFRRNLNIECLMNLFEEHEFHDMRNKLLAHQNR